MQERFLKSPSFNRPYMVAAWPGMGYLSKISIDYLKRQLGADLFAEIVQYQNAITYRDGVVDLPIIRHSFYTSSNSEIILCVGDAQPNVPEEAYLLACKVAEVAQKCNVRRIYTFAAYPDEYIDSPKVFGIASTPELVGLLKERNIEIGMGEGFVNGLNGLLIGVAKEKGIEGICLLGQIKYVNVPQLRSSKAILDTLAGLLELKLDTATLEGRAERLEERIRRKLEKYHGTMSQEKKEPRQPRYIS